MSKSATFTYDFMRLVYNAVAIPNVADNAGSSPNTQIIVGLHYADPGEGGNLSTNAVAYDDYAPAAVPRSSAGWTVGAGGAVSNAAQVSWPESAGGVATGAYWSTALSTGTAKILHSGQLTTPLAITVGVAPEAAAGALDITED